MTSSSPTQGSPTLQDYWDWIDANFDARSGWLVRPDEDYREVWSCKACGCLIAERRIHADWHLGRRA